VWSGEASEGTREARAWRDDNDSKWFLSLVGLFLASFMALSNEW
jgi:hypothetical protein